MDQLCIRRCIADGEISVAIRKEIDILSKEFSLQLESDLVSRIEHISIDVDILDISVVERFNIYKKYCGHVSSIALRVGRSPHPEVFRNLVDDIFRDIRELDKLTLEIGFTDESGALVNALRHLRSIGTLEIGVDGCLVNKGRTLLSIPKVNRLVLYSKELPNASVIEIYFFSLWEIKRLYELVVRNVKLTVDAYRFICRHALRLSVLEYSSLSYRLKEIVQCCGDLVELIMDINYAGPSKMFHPRLQIYGLRGVDRMDFGDRDACKMLKSRIANFSDRMLFPALVSINFMGFDRDTIKACGEGSGIFYELVELCNLSGVHLLDDIGAPLDFEFLESLE